MFLKHPKQTTFPTTDIRYRNKTWTKTQNRFYKLDNTFVP